MPCFRPSNRGGASRIFGLDQCIIVVFLDLTNLLYDLTNLLLSFTLPIHCSSRQPYEVTLIVPWNIWIQSASTTVLTLDPLALKKSLGVQFQSAIWATSKGKRRVEGVSSIMFLHSMKPFTLKPKPHNVHRGLSLSHMLLTLALPQDRTTVRVYNLISQNVCMN